MSKFIIKFSFFWALLFLLSSFSAYAGVAAKDKLWPNGKQIRVHFMNGTEDQKDFVRGTAAQWQNFGNVSFTNANGTNDSDIRIRFVDTLQGRNGFSLIGTDALLAREQEETMTLRLPADRLNTESGRRTVLHEFGHAIGLLHEHQSPAANLCWDEEATIAELQPQGFSIDDIYAQFITPHSELDVNRTVFDPDSIMMFPLLDSFLTCRGGFSKTLELSALDKNFLGQIYPEQASTPSTPVATPPTPPVQTVSMTSGGCQYVASDQRFDPTLPLSLFLSMLYLFRRKSQV